MQGWSIIGIMFCVCGFGLGFVDVLSFNISGILYLGILFNLFGIALMIFSDQLKRDKEESDKKFLEARDKEIRSWGKRK